MDARPDRAECGRGAPFPWHTHVFNADGTMQQANPDAGNARTSDSDGKGVRVSAGDTVRGKFVEMRADRATHGLIGRGEISSGVLVRGDSLVGSASAKFLDANGARSEGPFTVDMVERPLTLPSRRAGPAVARRHGCPAIAGTMRSAMHGVPAAGPRMRETARFMAGGWTVPATEGRRPSR